METLLKKEKKRGKVWDREGERHRALECSLEEKGHRPQEMLSPIYTLTTQGSEIMIGQDPCWTVA